MADPILDSATAKRDAALREAHEWQQFIERYHLLAEALPSLPDTEGLRAGRELDPDTETAKTVAAVAATLEEAGRPMRLAGLYEAVKARGIVFSGANPKDNLGARLYNSKQFMSLGKKIGWWFADRPVPEVPAEPNEALRGRASAPPHIPVGLIETVSNLALTCSSHKPTITGATWQSGKETPDNGKLSGAPKANEMIPLAL